MEAGRIDRLGSDALDAVVEVLYAAFADGPVLRWTLGDAPGYAARLPVMVRLFASSRAMRGEPILGLSGDDGRLLGVALVTPPVSRLPPEAFLALREATWARLGVHARARYDALVAAWGRTAVDGEHHHLNMLGLRGNSRGRGLSHPPLEAVIALAESDPASAGIDLTTERADNLPLYERFGFRVTVREDVGGGFLTTWTMFRPRTA